VERLSWYENVEQDNDFLIIGAGASLKDHIMPIKNFINDKKLISIGINKITEFIIPDYHLWTNNQRLHDQMNYISSKSKLILGIGIANNLIKKLNCNYIQVNYINGPLLRYKYMDGIIYGNLRTAGILAIVIAKIFGAKKIPELAKTLGKAKGDYEKAKIESEKDLPYKDVVKIEDDNRINICFEHMKISESVWLGKFYDLDYIIGSNNNELGFISKIEELK